MSSLARFAVCGVLAALCGCTPNTTVSTTDSPTTTSEAEAISAATAAIAALTTSIDTTQSGTTGQSGGQSAADAPSTEVTCPSVTFTLPQASAQVLSVTLDFGTGCTLNSVDGFACSGSATGTYDAGAATIALEFAALTCDGKGLDGDVSLGFTRANSTVTVAGDFDLAWTGSDGEVGTDGTGTATFDATARHTTIETFNGAVTQDGATYTLACDAIQTSYATYGNLTPFSGEMTVSASSIRTVSIRFNENSPTSGAIEISVAGGEYQDANLSDL